MHKQYSIRVQRASGFTIVELLIVIVVVAILAAISVVAYTGIQQKADNTATVSAVSQYVKGLSMYHTKYGAYPGPVYDTATDTRYITCMDGTADCWANDDAVRSAAVADALRETLGSLPAIPSDHAFTYSAIDGYYVLYTQANRSDCPAIGGTTQGSTTVSGSNVQCRARLAH